MKELRRRKICKNIYRWAVACAACLMLLAFGITGLAARIGTVTVNNVNVRKEASAESDRVCQLPSGTTVTILEETQGGDGNIWYNTSFTYEGAETTGWIRSDMLNISETEEDPEGEAPQGAGESIGGFTILEPEESREVSDALTQTEILVGEEYRTVWQVNPELTGGWELYLVYAAREDGSTNWFFYDSSEGTFQRDLGQFSGGAGEPEGLLQALQSELTQLKEDQEKQLSQRMYLIVGLGVLSAILLILVIVFAVKYRNAEYEYYDDEEDEDDEDDEYYDEPVAKKKRGFLRRKETVEEEEIEEGNDFDEFVAAVRKKWSEGDDEKEEYSDEDESDDEEGYEEDDFEEEDAEDELPEIDMSAVLEIEEEAQKTGKQSRKESEEDDIDGFDIEILDFDDLDV